MIIRSQDKRKIIPLNQPVYIETVVDEWKISTERYFLGTYSTEEKAIKVLDMICEKYKEPIVRANYTDNESLIYANSVFQMPQDSEV